ncbi:MAG: chemotaxis protein CheW [Terriglobales bacterium]
MANEQQWIAFRIAEQAYGLPIASVREIVRAPDITPVPQTPQHIAGVTNLRGRVIPVIDLRIKLQRPAARSPKSRVLVLMLDGRLLGVLVDEANEVLKIAPAEIEASPNLFGEEDESYVSGIAKHRGRLVVLLDPEKLLQHEIAPETALV